MVASRGLAVALLATMERFHAVTATPDNVSSRLSIHIPHSLYKEEGYEHREALFGVPPYGGSIAQNMYYADSDLCESNVDTKKGYPVREKGEDGKMKPWPSPYILMVNRGGCTFVQKVRNAQRSGAAGVVIADNTCLCKDTDCVSANKDGSCQTAEPIMADDGSGTDITIPAFLMFKHDADAVKAELMANNIVQLEMAWSLPSPDDRVEYDLWTVPTEAVSRPFLKDFQKVAEALGSQAYFTPHMFIYYGIKSGCQGANGLNQCYNLCTNNGRYCATDPDNNLDKGISGADVVLESLRRICIWKHYGEANGIGSEWWNYVNEFRERCDTPDFFTNDDCIRDAYKRAKTDERIVDQCIRDSGGTEKDASNAFLDTELDAQQQRGVVILPTAFVNTAALRGALTVANVFTAICAGYLAGTEPKICELCNTCPDKATCAQEGKCTMGGISGGGGRVSFKAYIFSLVAVVGALGGVGFLYYRRSQDEMREQVRGILAEYMPLEDQEGDGSDINPAMDFARKHMNTQIS